MVELRLCKIAEPKIIYWYNRQYNRSLGNKNPLIIPTTNDFSFT